MITSIVLIVVVVVAEVVIEVVLMLIIDYDVSWLNILSKLLIVH
jgi:hypothetical protein